MPWFKVDDGLWSHPKVEALEDSVAPAIFAKALALWLLAGSYCARYETDGRISYARCRKLVPFRPRVAIEALVGAGLWTELRSDEYQFHDWTDFQPDAESTRKRREQDAKRKRKARNVRADASRAPARTRRAGTGRGLTSEEEVSPEAVSLAAVAEVTPFEAPVDDTPRPPPSPPPWLAVYREWARGYEAAAKVMAPHPGRHEAEAREVVTRLQDASARRQKPAPALLADALAECWADPWWERKGQAVPLFSHFARRLQRYLDPPKREDPVARERRETAAEYNRRLERDQAEHDEWRRRTFGDPDQDPLDEFVKGEPR